MERTLGLCPNFLPANRGAFQFGGAIYLPPSNLPPNREGGGDLGGEGGKTRPKTETHPTNRPILTAP